MKKQINYRKKKEKFELINQYQASLIIDKPAQVFFFLEFVYTCSCLITLDIHTMVSSTAA